MKTIEMPHVKEVCKLGHGEKCCSYLGMSQGWTCLKESTLKDTIDARRSAGTMNSKGDNCEGYEKFKNK